MSKKNLIVSGVIIILLSIIFALFLRLQKEKADFRDQRDLYEAITDTVKFYKNKDSLNVAKIQQILSCKI